jgi:hypothetical protein
MSTNRRVHRFYLDVEESIFLLYYPFSSSMHSKVKQQYSDIVNGLSNYFQAQGIFKGRNPL